jgi:plasmid stabilization system protein ParE
VSDPLPVSFTRRASADVEEAGRWWRENRTKAPDAFAEELARALDLIASQPQIGATARNVALAGIRRILLGRVNYYVYYRVSDRTPRSIEVVALWHASRNSEPI